MSMIFGIFFFNTGKILLSIVGIKKEEKEELDPLRVKTLDEIKNSKEITGQLDNYNDKAKRVGFYFWLFLLILIFVLI